jgi:cytochrome oxidase Cu insertion factor (SCO1/SenC/PrrC family)
MNGSAVKYWLVVACLLVAFYGSFVAWRHAHSEPSVAAAPRPSAPEPKGEPLTDFVLTDQAGETFDSATLRGKIWVGSFFFTNCPSACWRMNQALAAIQHMTPTSDVRYISITCDPDSDTPQALAKYAEHFKADPARWTFLTGDLKVAKQLGNQLKVDVVEKSHSDRAFLVDRNGQVRGRFRLTEADQVEMLKKLLAVVEAEPAQDTQPKDGGAAVAPGGDKQPP